MAVASNVLTKMQEIAVQCHRKGARQDHLMWRSAKARSFLRHEVGPPLASPKDLPIQAQLTMYLLLSSNTPGLLDLSFQKPYFGSLDFLAL